MQHILCNRKMWNYLGIILIMAIIWFFGIKTPAYSVMIDGHKQFVVENSKDVTNALDKMENQDFAKRVICKRTFVSRSELMPSEKVAEELKVASQPHTMAASIIVNGKSVVSLPNKATAEAMLNQLKKNNSLLAAGEKLLSVEFEEKVEVVEGKVVSSKILTWNDAWNVINIGTDSLQKYNVQPGDSLWTIARKNDMYVSDIVQTNHLQEDSVLALGQVIILNKPTPCITVIAKVEGKENVVIPYETKTITDNAISGIKVKTEGQNGEKFVAYTAVKRNGELEKKDVSEEKIIKQAVPKVVAKGSRATYQVASRGGVSSGRLIWPVQGSISQSYGGRHTGIDIAGPSGTKISAADGGTVTFVGWDGGYGKFVIINHGNGLVTRYAHCSSFLVSSGQKVDQGQAIATRGSTGRSTGPHLHFEVLQNGSFRNPINYLR